MTWMPIETAPKDGTHIMVWEPTFKSIEFSWWGNDYNVKDYLGWLCGDGDDWSTGFYHTPITPTHWMPMPNPPEEV